MNLSKNFTLNELTKSQESIRLSIDNTPSEEHILNLKSLCENILQPIRDFYQLPVSVSSGYRSLELCKAIGSSATSQHTKGQAADFEIFSVDNAKLADWIHENLQYDQLILEFYIPGEPNSGWIHCSYIPEGRRRQFLLAYKSEGKTKYKPVLGKAVDLI